MNHLSVSASCGRSYEQVYLDLAWSCLTKTLQLIDVKLPIQSATWASTFELGSRFCLAQKTRMVHEADNNKVKSGHRIRHSNPRFETASSSYKPNALSTKLTGLPWIFMFQSLCYWVNVQGRTGIDNRYTCIMIELIFHTTYWFMISKASF